MNGDRQRLRGHYDEDFYWERVDRNLGWLVRTEERKLLFGALTPPTLSTGESPDIPFASANWIRFNGCHLSRPRPVLESWNGRRPVSRHHHITETTLSTSFGRPDSSLLESLSQNT